MRVGINGISLNFKRKTTGIGRYVLSLLKELQHRENLTIYVFIDRLFKWRELKALNFRNVYPVFIPCPTFLSFLREFWTRRVLALYLKIYPIDVFFAPDGILPGSGYRASVGTIHDLAFLKYPETLKKGALKFFSNYYKLTMLHSDQIITVSSFSKSDILQNYDVSSGKINVIYNGVSDFFFEQPDEAYSSGILLKFNVNRSFIFYLGTLEPRKNLNTVIKVFTKLANKYDTIDLVIGGVKGWLTQSLNEELGLYPQFKDRIMFLGNLSDEEYRSFLYKCLVFIYIPFYEGFGLPVLEAMAAGCNIITSDTSSIPEIAGETCIRVNPTDVEAIVGELDLLLSSPKRINIEAIERAKEFSWKKSADEHLKIFAKAFRNIIDR